MFVFVGAGEEVVATLGASIDTYGNNMVRFHKTSLY